MKFIFNRILVAMITDSKVFRSFGDRKSSSFYFLIMISYPKFGSCTRMFRIPDMIDEFRVICFIFKDGVEFLVFYLFLSNLAGGFSDLLTNNSQLWIGKWKGF